MGKSIQAALIAFALAGAPLLLSLPAAADGVSVSVNPGGIAFGYTDGYWDYDHHWHAWRDHQEAEHYQAQYRDHYYDWKHDRDHDQGWHDSDRWWNHH